MLDINNFLRGNRLKHTYGVLENVKLIARDESRIMKNYLKMAALLHDIGYSDKVKRDGSHHSLDGYHFVRKNTPLVVAYLVLMHTGAEDLIPEERRKEFLRERKKCERMLEWEGFRKDQLTRLLTLLNWADVHTSPEGDFIASEARLVDVQNRYGADSITSLSLKKVIENIHQNL